MAIYWTPDMIAKLREMRSAGETIYLCAERIGVAYPTAVFKCRELCIAGRMNRGRVPGRTTREHQRDAKR